MVVQDAPAWQTLLLQKSAMFQLCAMTNDFRYLDAVKSLKQQTPMTVNLSFMATANTKNLIAESAIEDHTKEKFDTDAWMKKHTEEANAALDAEAKEFHDQVKADIDSGEAKKDPDAWKAKMRQKAEERKKKSVDAIQKSTDEAIEQIAKLPEEKREKAADRWDTLQDWLQETYQKMLDFFNKALAAVVQAIVIAWEAVKNACINAYNTCKTFVQETAQKVDDFFSDLF